MATSSNEFINNFRGEDDLLFVVDVSSFIFRAYYSVGYLSTSDGTPTGAVFGVANMLTSLFADYNPSHVVVAMDSKTPSFRKEIYPEYKANRPPPPEDLKAQFPIIAELLEAFDLPTLQKDGFEADDLIATVAQAMIADNKKVVIISADKDLMQLIDERVLMLDTMKDKVWDRAAVEEKWGVPPELVGDLLAIAGDSSDNIPGVPRVGPKTAAPLLMQFGSLENLLQRTEEIKAKGARSKMEEHAEMARLSKRLVELDRAVSMEFSYEGFLYREPSREKLGPLLEKLELRQLSDRLLGKAPVAPKLELKLEYVTISDTSTLEQVAMEAAASGRFAIDLETTSVDAVAAQIVGVALSYEELKAYYVPVAHTGETTNISLDEVLRILRPLLENEDLAVVIQNVKYEDTIFRRHDIVMKAEIFDPMLASYLMRGENRRHNMDVLAADFLDRGTISYDDVTEKQRGHQLTFDQVGIDKATTYAAEDAEITLALANAMEPKVQDAGMQSLLVDVEIPLARVLSQMELAGVAIDLEHLALMSKSLGDNIGSLESRAHELAGHSFNLASPKQLQHILFEELGLPTQRKTKTGYSTDSEVLEILATMHELPALLLDHRLYAKLKSTYVDALPKMVNPETGRIHTSFNQAVTATGRLSSSNPNLQNIPIRSDVGREIRQAFIPSKGNILVSADYSQVELRILAHLSQDEQLLDAFQNGKDIHARTAKAIFGAPTEEDVTREQRSQAKAVNFGVIYGKTDFSLAKELGIPRSEAKRFIQEYFQLYSGVERYMNEIIEEAHNTKRVSTLLGRIRELRDIDASNHNVRTQAERMARNTPIQGTAADLLKLAMIKVAKALETEAPEARMILTVHDELVFEVPEHTVEQVCKTVKSVMEGAMQLAVPLTVDVGHGSNWAEAH